MDDHVGFSFPQNGDSQSILRRLFGGRGAGDVTSQEAPVIAITSGKGGTGKSFMATNLAVAMGRDGRRIALVDCDFGLGNAHLLLGVNPRMTLQHVLGNQARIETVLAKTPYGPRLVPAGSGISRLADLSEEEMLVFAQSLTRLAASSDVVLLDTAAGISPQCLLTLLMARYILLVTNPEIAALTDAYALIKCLSRRPSRPAIGVVVNRVPRRGVGKVTFDKLATVARRFVDCPLHYLGEVPDDPTVTQRRLGQPPLLASHPDCEAARCIVEITENVARFAGGLRRRELSGHESLMHRFRLHVEPARV